MEYSQLQYAVTICEVLITYLPSISKISSTSKNKTAAKGEDPTTDHEICSKLTITLSIFLTFFKRFCCWLWIGKCLLGCLYAYINSKSYQIENITTNFGQYFVKYILFHLIYWCQNFCKWTVSTDFSLIHLNICENCSFTENFQTNKLDEKCILQSEWRGLVARQRGSVLQKSISRY